MKQENQEITKEEIKKEFQLERMILFSDAVFAIVITLMAIEIHLPESHEKYTEATFFKAVKHLAPVIFAYALSFFFIGQMWYKHLQMFRLLKDYNKGLVIRNLIFLFFIGLFPFGASLITTGNIMLPILIYMIIIMCCFITQIFLHDYIINRSPALVMKVDLTEEKLDLKRTSYTIITMIVCAILAYITSMMIEDQDDKAYSFAWMIAFVIIARIINEKYKTKAKHEKTYLKHE